METPIEMDDFGSTMIFGNTQIHPKLKSGKSFESFTSMTLGGSRFKMLIFQALFQPLGSSALVHSEKPPISQPC